MHTTSGTSSGLVAEEQPAATAGRVGWVGLVASVAIVLLYCGLRLWNLSAYSLWGDEVFSLRVARMGLDGLLDTAALDAVHPPLFYLLLKLWISVGGESVAWVRLLPAAISIAALVPLGLLCRDAGLRFRESLCAGVLIAVNPYLVHYSQELRMYSLLFAASLLSLWLVVRFVRMERVHLGFVVALFATNLVLVYTHYFGWLVIGLEGVLVLLVRPRSAIWFGAVSAALAASFAPWVVAVVRASQGSRGVDQEFRERPGLQDLVAWFGSLDGPADVLWITVAGILVFVIPVVLLAWRWFRASADEPAPGFGPALLAVMGLLPPLLVFAASHVLENSIWRDRYLIISAAPYLMLASVAAWRLTNRRIRAVWVVLLLGFAVAGAVHGKPTDQRLDLQAIVDRMVESEAGSGAETVVYARGWRVASPLQFCLEQAGATGFRVKRVPDVDSIDGDHFWVAYAEARLKGKGDPVETLERRGFRIGEPVATGEPGNRILLVPVWSQP